MVNQSAVFDIYDVFVNELVGSLILTVIIILVIIYLVSTKFQIPFPVTFMLSLLFLMIIVSYNTGMVLLWTMIVLLIGLILYYPISRFINRG